MLLSAEHISLNFGLKQLLDDVTLYIQPGDKIGIIGINGTGKSSLLRVLAGKQVPDEGTVSPDPNVQVSFLSQNPDMTEENTKFTASITPRRLRKLVPSMILERTSCPS